MPSQGGLINTTALAIQYDRAFRDTAEDPTAGLWNRLLNDIFGADSWIVTPQKRQGTGRRPDFGIERFWPNHEPIDVVVVEAKPQRQSMSQDHYADDQVLEYAKYALENGHRYQQKIFALRVVGTYVMGFKVTKAREILEPLSSDYMDAKNNAVAIMGVFDAIKNADVFDPN
ncbi:hypothetical protein MferCBS31731_005712 [Microsporum ferrugineum]